MSKALELIRTLIDGANEYEKKTGNTNPTVYLSRNNLLIIEKALKRLKSIDNSNPSEALECLERIGAEKLARGELIRNDDKVEPYFNTIKQALLKAQKEHKALEIIKEKNVAVAMLKSCGTVERYNTIAFDEERSKDKNYARKLTEEEFNLLKEVLKWAD